MTLVELLVAISIMLIVLAGVAAGANSGLRLARGNTNRIVAANIADQQIGDVRAMDFADIPQTTVSGTVTQGATEYTWTRDADMVFVGAEESCEAPSGAFNADTLSYLRIVVEVTWPRMEGIDPVRSETLMDPPVADYDPYRGHLAVQVNDRAGAPVPGMTVHLRNADAATPTTNVFDTTNADGCVLFDSLEVITDQTVGHYYVWLDREGWVDRASGLSDTSLEDPRPVVNVVSAQLRKLEFDYDRAAYLDVDLVGRFGGAPADGLPVTITNDNYNRGNGPVVFDPTADLAAEPLHPFTAGFSLWAGSCPDADPGALHRTRLATDPDATTTGDVTMGTARLNLYRKVRGDNVPITGARVVAISDCGTPYTVAQTTDSQGGVTVALPYGTWTLDAIDYTPRSPSSWPEFTLSPDDTAMRTITKRVR